jgi:hypothetical protein
VGAWIANPSGYIITAYDPKHAGELLTDEQMRRSYPAAFRWLRGHAGQLKARKGPPTRSWDLTGPDWARLEGPLTYMLQPNIVVVRELQRRPAAAIVSPAFDNELSKTVSPLIDHKLTFCAVDTPDEAVYLATMINSTPIQELLASFANSLAVAPQTLARLPIPEFDVRVHTAVVDVGGMAIKAARSGGAIDMGLVDDAASAALSISPSVDSSEAAAASETC